MKYLGAVTVFLIALSGCGKNPVTESGSDQQRTFEPVVVGIDAALRSEVASLCGVLNDKDLYFRNNYLNGTSKFNFTTKQINCDGTQVSSAAQALLSFTGGGLQYQKLIGDYFVSQVETRTSGVMSSLCANVAALTQPLLLGNALALRYGLTRGDRCSSNPNMRCVTVESAVKQNSGQFLVTKVDAFQVDVSSGVLTGMVMNHEHWNYDLCADGKKLINTSTFTGITN